MVYSSQRTKSFTWRVILQSEDFIHIITFLYIHLCRWAKAWRFQEQTLQRTKSGTSYKNYQRGIHLKLEGNKTSSTKRRLTTAKFLSPHWWTFAAWNIQNRQGACTKTQAGKSCAEIASKTTQVVMQYSPNKEHQRLRWLPLKCWTLFPCCQACQEKQTMLFPAYTQDWWGKEKVEVVLLHEGWKKVPRWACLYFLRKSHSFCQKMSTT